MHIPASTAPAHSAMRGDIIPSFTNMPPTRPSLFNTHTRTNCCVGTVEKFDCCLSCKQNLNDYREYLSCHMQANVIMLICFSLPGKKSCNSNLAYLDKRSCNVINSMLASKVDQIVNVLLRENWDVHLDTFSSKVMVSEDCDYCS
jgi:hypothetical protein